LPVFLRVSPAATPTLLVHRAQHQIDFASYGDARYVGFAPTLRAQAVTNE
jgi:hypothetical protein